MAPNPTLFQAQEWPLKDSADPLDEWHLSELLKTKYGKADKDIYSKLYVSVRQMLSAFMSKLYTQRHIFELYKLNATELPNHCAEDNFARIEVSNIADVGYLGLGRTVGYLGPLLQRPQENLHATLITLFMNAIGETVSDSEQMRIVKAEMKQVLQYRSLIRTTLLYDGQSIMASCARDLVKDVDKYFDQYMGIEMKKFGFHEVPQYLSMVKKDRHTVIEKWPLRLQLRPHQRGAKEEFATLLSSAHTGNERYVEWKRID
ncbi:hypothetical protein LTR22_027412 [Elasticomyces elasticus]|nr:hypothetical protein LTR22_027412 [Elasticomyces elasticus]